jgi:hypothetical protein
LVTASGKIKYVVEMDSLISTFALGQVGLMICETDQATATATLVSAGNCPDLLFSQAHKSLSR